MQTFDAIRKRASVREYAPRSVGKDILEQLVDAGRRAPSARAVEPWEFIVVTAKPSLSALADIAENGRFLREAAAGIVIFSQDTKYYLEDGAAATENILLLAADLGLGACWVAGDKKPYAQKVGDLLGVARGFKLVSIISLGWPRNAPEQKKKRSLSDVIHWEKF